MPHIRDIFLGQGVPEPYRSNRTNITDNNMFGCTTPEPLSASTKKLFQAIDDENLEDFKQALAEGADVNAFDEEGMTPLMSIINGYAVSSYGQHTLEKMAKLLIQNRSININAQSKQSVYEERQKIDRSGRAVYTLLVQGEQKEVVAMLPGCYIDCDNGQYVNNVDDWGERIHPNPYYDSVMESVKTNDTEENTALHIACQVGVKDIVKILPTHPDIRTDVKNYEGKSPEGCTTEALRNAIKLEFEKARKGKRLLTVFSNRSIYLADILLDGELNPNCWERDTKGEIQTSFDLIVKLCLHTITRDKEEVLTKLLKHKDLDFSQIKPKKAIEPRLQLIIVQAITERLTDTIKRKDLDDVKKLVEDNCFMNYAIVAAALRDVGDPIESITNYLNEKFPVSVERPLAGMNDIPVGFEKFVQELVDRLEKAKAQLAEKEKELSDTRQELNKRNDEIGKQQNRILELERELHHAKIRLANGDIKKSAEDNRFMSRAIVTAASENVNKKIPASAERPLASTDSTPVGFEQGVAKLADELESVQAQLAEKEKKLSDIKQELNKRNNEIREQQNRISELERELDQAKAQLAKKDRKLNNTREESNERIHRIGKESDGRAISPNRKQNNYALTFFILCGICAVGACLTIVDYPEVSACLAAVALGLFLVGYYLYKTDEQDIGPSSTTDSPQVTGFYSFSRFC